MIVKLYRERKREERVAERGHKITTNSDPRILSANLTQFVHHFELCISEPMEVIGMFLCKLTLYERLRFEKHYWMSKMTK